MDHPVVLRHLPSGSFRLNCPNQAARGREVITIDCHSRSELDTSYLGVPRLIREAPWLGVQINGGLLMDLRRYSLRRPKFCTQHVMHKNCCDCLMATNWARSWKQPSTRSEAGEVQVLKSQATPEPAPPSLPLRSEPMPPIITSTLPREWGSDIERREGFVEEERVPATPFFLPIGGEIPLDPVPTPKDIEIESCAVGSGFVSRSCKNRKGAGGRLRRKVRIKCERPWEV